MTTCERCDGNGYTYTCEPDGGNEHTVACNCDDGDAWYERQRHAADPHERAAARARGNDFADTDGRDWT